MKKDKTVADLANEAPKDINIPWHVHRFLGKNTISFAGNQVSLGEDFGSICELRKAIEYYVEQLNGEVKWKEKLSDEKDN